MGEDATASRLTAAGVEAVAEMERLGILLDISHLSASGVGMFLSFRRGRWSPRIPVLALCVTTTAT